MSQHDDSPMGGGDAAPPGGQPAGAPVMTGPTTGRVTGARTGRTAEPRTGRAAEPRTGRAAEPRTGRAAEAGRRPRSQALGAYGEAYAARHLVERGLVVLDRNWRCELGEIDLVLRDGDTVVFCEVKTRSSTSFGNPVETVTERKAARLRRLAARWLAEHQLGARAVRLDVVGVLVPRDAEPSLEHLRGVG